MPGYPSILRIFRVGCSPFWYARVFIHGKYRKTTLKTTNKSLAIQRAKDFYSHNFGIDIKIKFEISGRKFDTVAQIVMAADERKVKLGELSPTSLSNNKYAYERHIKEELGGMEIQLINFEVLEKFANGLAEKNLTGSSIKRFMSFVSKVLKQAFKHDIIQRVPPLPAIKAKSGVRGVV